MPSFSSWKRCFIYASTNLSCRIAASLTSFNSDRAFVLLLASSSLRAVSRFLFLFFIRVYVFLVRSLKARNFLFRSLMRLLRHLMVSRNQSLVIFYSTNYVFSDSKRSYTFFFSFFISFFPSSSFFNHLSLIATFCSNVYI